MDSREDIKPFRISVSDEQLRDLHAKLELTRLPDELDLPAGKEWDWGIPLAVVKPLVEYWRTQYDWRAVEERINRTLPQFTTQLESSNHGIQEIHFVHKRSDNPSATPLLFAHGWPGSFLEVSKIIDDLTNPKDPKHPAFHVVAPSLPGFVFSQRASTPGMGIKATADLFDKLMIKLGYKYYVSQGGDWGSMICRAHAVYHQDTCLGTHSNLNFANTPTALKAPLMMLKTALGFAGLPGGYSKEEIQGIKGAKEFLEIGSGYSKIQGTRPQTLAFGLTDSPVGLLAWIGEKLHVWTDNYPWTPEEFITWVMLYWINGPAGGLRYYKETYGLAGKGTPERAELERLASGWSSTPHGFSWFPKEVVCFPVEWNSINQPLLHAKKHNRGGHFAAWEAPELLVEDIRDFVKLLLEKEPRLRNA